MKTFITNLFFLLFSLGCSGYQYLEGDDAIAYDPEGYTMECIDDPKIASILNKNSTAVIEKTRTKEECFGKCWNIEQSFAGTQGERSPEKSCNRVSWNEHLKKCVSCIPFQHYRKNIHTNIFILAGGRPNICNGNSCQNGATCDFSRFPTINCNCAEGYSGENCEIESEKQFWMKIVFPIIGVLVILLLILICCYCRRKSSGPSGPSANFYPTDTDLLLENPPPQGYGTYPSGNTPGYTNPSYGTITAAPPATFPTPTLTPEETKRARIAAVDRAFDIDQKKKDDLKDIINGQHGTFSPTTTKDEAGKPYAVYAFSAEHVKDKVHLFDGFGAKLNNEKFELDFSSNSLHVKKTEMGEFFKASQKAGKIIFLYQDLEIADCAVFKEDKFFY